jgi:hypothetical protein
MPPPHPIRFGFQTGQQNVGWTERLELWQECEQLGFASGWNFDHFIPIFSGALRAFAEMVMPHFRW